MNFQTLIKVNTADEYLDLAFRRAKEIANTTRSKRFANKYIKSKNIEMDRLKAIHKSLVNNLENILNSFPDLENLPPFYLELVKCTIDYPTLKKSLGALNWARNKLEQFFNYYLNPIKRTRLENSEEINKLNIHRREFYGRVSSIMKQIKEPLLFLEESRKIMKRFPAIKTSVDTVIISGYPNVGKSTLLKKLTGSNVNIQPYAFTTKHINIGYLEKNRKTIQLIDVPGTFDRSFKDMNDIERQAYLVMKHLTTKILFVIDPTEACGYGAEQQVALLNNIKRQYKLPLMILLNKSDMKNNWNNDFIKKLKDEEFVEISAEKNIGLEKINAFL